MMSRERLMKNHELLELKRKLYHALLKKESKDLTENEVNIMFYLSKDEQIQELLNDLTKKTF